jgi:hypothetical protein
VANWCREFALWAPELPLLVIEGDQARRHWQWQLPDVPVKIANFELLHRDREAFEPPDSTGKSPLCFDLVVLDESQRIKNRSSATSQAVRTLSRSRNWALTGTPVENSPEDLVGIFEFLAPGLLSSEMKPRAARERGDTGTEAAAGEALLGADHGGRGGSFRLRCGPVDVRAAERGCRTGRRGVPGPMRVWVPRDGSGRGLGLWWSQQRQPRDPAYRSGDEVVAQRGEAVGGGSELITVHYSRFDPAN